MTADATRTVEPHDRRIALGATGLLRTFNRAEVLTAADVHVAQRLGRLLHEDDEQVLLAVAIAISAVVARRRRGV